MAGPSPAHIGYVQKSYRPALELNKSAEVGYVADDTGHEHTLLQRLEKLLLVLFPLLADRVPARYHYIAAGLVYLHDLKLERLSEDLVKISERPAARKACR